MRWKCPHCETGLNLNEETIDSSWFFSKCIDCDGMSLIKRAEVQVIKVSHAPSGERVHSPGRVSLPKEKKIKLSLLKTKPAPLEPSAQSPRKRNLKPAWLALQAMAVSTFIVGGVLIYKALELQGSRTPVRVIEMDQNLKKSSQDIEITQISPQESNVLRDLDQSEPIAKAEPPARSQTPEKTDTLTTAMMAPKRPIQEDATSKPIFIAVKDHFANLRSGPGLEFPIVSVANPKMKFLVTDWNGRWFKIEEIQNGQKSVDNYWIRNDLVIPIEPQTVPEERISKL